MNFAEELKRQINIVDVVQQYLSLKRQGSGQRWKGLCPFHSEKTPSFNVDGGHQFYKCFGCEAGGDVLKFVQEIESLTFPETLRLLAERYGIAMPERQHADNEEAQRHGALLEIHEAAAELFQGNLRGAGGTEARAYLTSRGVSSDAIREFRLGLSDSSGQQLAQKLKRFGEALLLDSGLILKRQEGPGVYDRFRGRLMFPIHDGTGKVIAFGGRALRPDDKVKYLNSPETKLYTKSMVLFNLHRAKVPARKNDRMVLVEGYLDTIAVYTAGIQEVVALCGTALGTQQIRAMKQEISHQAGRGHIVLNLDSDAAGVRSTEKHIAPLLAQGMRVKVLEIPGGLDPDEYLQANGAEGYRKLLERAPSYFHWLTDQARTKYDLRTAEGRVDAFKAILPAIEHVHDRIERAAIASEMAEQLGVDRDMVRQALRRQSSVPEAQRPPDIASAAPPNEKLLIACMLASGEARAVIAHYLAQPGSLDRLELKPIFEAILSANAAETFSVSAALSKLDGRLQNILGAISFSESGVAEEHAAEQALDCLKQLELKSMQTKCDSIKRRIREFEIAGDMNEALRLMNELDRMQRPSRGV